MDRRTFMHKAKPARFTNLAFKREDGFKKIQQERKTRRTENFITRRNIPREDYGIDEEKTKNKPDKAADRKMALLKYKTEKEALKKQLKKNTRPPFKVGIPHHGSSPILKDTSNVNMVKKKSPFKLPIKPQQEAIRMTRSRTNVINANIQKTMLPPSNPPVKIFPFNERKSHFNFNIRPAIKKIKKLTSPHTPTVLKRSAQKNPTSKKIFTHNLVKQIIKSKPSTSSTDSDELALPIPHFAEVELEVDYHKTTTVGEFIPETNTEVPTKSKKHSSSGAKQLNTSVNGNFEKPVLTQNIESLTSNRAICSEGSTPLHQDTNINSDTVGDFQRFRLDSETSRLLKLANNWEEAIQQQMLPQEVKDEIDSLVGQTRLLTQDKFNQFRNLINEFESKSGTHRITIDDLNGFWDMMYLQVEGLMKRYTMLDDLKQNNWIKPVMQVNNKKRKANRRQQNVYASSTIRETIRAKRAKMAAQIGQQDDLGMHFSEVGQSLGRTSHSPKPLKDTTPKSTIKKKINIESKEDTRENEPEQFMNQEIMLSPKVVSTEGEAIEISAITDENKEVAAVKNRSKKFVLRPSVLNINITNFGNSTPERSNAHDECLQLRRSTRKSSAKKVAFTACTMCENKNYVKMPATPYRKSLRSKKLMELDED